MAYELGWGYQPDDYEADEEYRDGFLEDELPEETKSWKPQFISEDIPM